MKVLNHHLYYADSRQVQQHMSPNQAGTLHAPRLLVIHYTAGRSSSSAVQWLCNPAAKAAGHIVIGKDGDVHQLVPFDRVAWHAGKSEWMVDGKMVSGINRYSIGIELDNPGRLVRQGDKWRSTSLGAVYDASEVIEATHKNELHPCGWHVYPSVQIEAALEVAQALLAAYPTIADVVGHDDVAPHRKSDPGPAFPMESFRARLFGRADDGDADDGDA